MKTEHGRRLADRYLLEEQIAEGGMAEVWRATDEVLGRSVAVKILHPHLAADETFFERFRREAVMAARLSHPAVVRVFDTGVDAETCFIVLELFEGRTLAQVLAERGPLEPGEAAVILRGALDGLAHAHDQGVIHRDVKPTNVLLHRRQVKVADFGIAKAATEADLTTTGELLGTVRYLAPEQVDAGDIDRRADLYAAGIVLYEMLTGRAPFEAETPIAEATLRLTEDPVPPSALRAGIPGDMDELVMHALRRDPDERFQTATEMAAALEPLADAPHRPAPPPVAPESHEEHGSFFRSWMLVPAVAIALAVAVIAIGLLLGRLELGGPLGIRTSDEEVSPEPTAVTAPLTVQGATAHDPEGDGSEHDADAPLAIDGDPGTAWQTEGYDSPDLGGIKDGVGLVLDLGTFERLAEVTVETPAPGWTFSIYGSADGESFGDPFEDESGANAFVAQETTTVRLAEARARYVLLWVTELTEVDGRFRALIAEAGITGG